MIDEIVYIFNRVHSDFIMTYYSIFYMTLCNQLEIKCFNNADTNIVLHVFLPYHHPYQPKENPYHPELASFQFWKLLPEWKTVNSKTEQ